MAPPRMDQVQNQSILETISKWVKAHGSPYRAGYHLHKAYDVDQLDPGQRPLVGIVGDLGKPVAESSLIYVS